MSKIDFSFFDKETNRFNTNSVKWDCKDDEIPLWIADMDFEVCPEIVDAIEKRTQNKIFGYTDITSEWYLAYINWFKRRHNVLYEKEWMMFTTGVVPAISSIVRKCSSVGENICVLTPVYNIFFNSIINNGRNPIESKLVYKDNHYEIDYKDLEDKLSNPQTSMLILCNPHNPIGHIWSKDELYKIALIASKYNVIVLCDEIHCDLTMPNKEYNPYLASVKDLYDNAIVCCAPTKTFNIAGLQTACIIVPNKFLRHKVWRGINTDEVAEPNVFAAIAPIAAYNNGDNWLDTLRNYIERNKNYVEKFINEKLSDYCLLVEQDATYLLWLDFSKITNDSNIICEYLRENAKVILSSGEIFRGNGKTFIRMNIACPFNRLKLALDRIYIALKNYNK